MSKILEKQKMHKFHGHRDRDERGSRWEHWGVGRHHRGLARQFTLFDNAYVSGTNSADVGVAPGRSSV